MVAIGRIHPFPRKRERVNMIKPLKKSSVITKSVPYNISYNPPFAYNSESNSCPLTKTLKVG